MKKMKQDYLKITADREEYTIGLTGHLNLGGFSGFGEGWFNISDVQIFTANLLSLGHEMEGSADLIGTQSKADGSELLERFCLRCYALAKSKVNGVIGVHVTLSEYPYTDCRVQEIFKVSGELKVRNQNIIEFSENLNRLLTGDIDEVSLTRDQNII